VKREPDWFIWSVVVGGVLLTIVVAVFILSQPESEATRSLRDLADSIR
jgi:uncharacterized integral membrane protein